MVKQEARHVAIPFGTRIAAKRKEKGITQEALAERLGISQESLSLMEKGQIAPRFERLRDFSRALDCSIADLFTESDQKYPVTHLSKAHAPRPTSTTVLATMFAGLSADTQKEVVDIVTRIVNLASYAPKD